MPVGVHHGFVFMACQAAQQHASAWTQHTRGFGHGLRGFGGVGQGVHQRHQVKAARLERQCVHVAFAHLDVAMRAQAFRGGRDDARAGVHADVAACVWSQQFGQHAVAGGDVQHVARLQQRQRGARQGLPGAAGGVMPLHVAGHAVGPVGVSRACSQHGGDAFGILAQQGVVAAQAYGLPQRALRSIEGRIVEAVVGRDAGAPVADEAGFFQLGEVRRDPRLGKPGDGRQLRNGQFLAFQQGQQAHAGGIGKGFEDAGPALQIHGYLDIAIEG